MALNGTLADLGVVDLVQFPASAKKTGELIIAGTEEEARLYYTDGALKHIVCGASTGEDVMTTLVGWSEGEFEFRQNVTSDMITVTTEVAELVSRAVSAFEAMAVKSHSPQSPATGILRTAIEDTAEKLQFVLHVALYTTAGELVCVWDRDEGDPEMMNLIDEVRNLFDTHPRKGLNKIYLTDTKGTCIATLVDEAFILLISADDLASLGMVSLATAKLTTAVTDTFQ